MGIYTPGVYHGKAMAVRGRIFLDVTCSENRMENIVITEHQEILGQAYGLETTPFECFIPAILQYQSLAVPFVVGAEAVCRAIVKAVSFCVNAAGGDAEALKAVPVPVPPKKPDSVLKTDVLVLGSGIAGLSAAVEARYCGADVVLVEKQDIVGGSSCISGGKLMAAGTKTQKAQGIYDTPAQMFDFLKETAGTYLNDTRVRYFTEEATPNLEWLEEQGFEIQDVEAPHASVLPWRVHNSMGCVGQSMGWGGGFIVPLYQRFGELGGKTLLHTGLTSLLMEDGRVTGAVAQDIHDGSTVTIHAKAVILATGGYAANRAVVEARYPWMQGYYYNCPESSQGDGARAAEEIGARNTKHPYLQTMLLNVHSGMGVNEEFGLIVTKEGKRFTNEYQFHSIVGAALADTGSNGAWYLTCGDEAAEFPQLALALRLPETCHGDSVAALAEAMGVPAETLCATVERYNALCDDGFDEDFEKPAEKMLALRGETYFAVPLTTASSITFGGLEIDISAQVLDEKRQAIPGLYAAGEVANTGNFGKAVPACGYSLGHALHFGRVAARAATGHALL
ncbi:MAG: FAD-dependent oxidoreductase [Oscillospiraceae bacterium]